jgi:hypothetical protein
MEERRRRGGLDPFDDRHRLVEPRHRPFDVHNPRGAVADRHGKRVSPGIG